MLRPKARWAGNPLRSRKNQPRPAQGATDRPGGEPTARLTVSAGYEPLIPASSSIRLAVYDRPSSRVSWARTSTGRSLIMAPFELNSRCWSTARPNADPSLTAWYRFRGATESPTYRDLVKPLHHELFEFLHARTSAKVFFHTCGAVRDLIPDLVEIGVDILNPVQVSAANMDSGELKREFGRDLTFWGGGVDTQGVLGSGTPAEVRTEVLRRVSDLGAGGGFVFAAVHNTQPNVPAANILVMRAALREANGG